VRISSLQSLQSLAVGDGGEFETFLSHLKAIHELVGLYALWRGAV
jgi:hypothetical protein